MRRSLIAVPQLLVLVVLVLCAADAARADTIEFLGTRKPQANVTVMDEKLDVVEYTIKNVAQRQTVNAADVADVVYDDPGADFVAAVEALDSAGGKDDYQSAGEMFRSV